MEKKKTAIPGWAWKIMSFVLLIVIWTLFSYSKGASIFLKHPWEVVQQILKKAADGSLWPNIGYSLERVALGFSLGFVIGIPVAFLMGWYSTFRNLVAPWIHFLRNIPALAYIPLVVVAAGVGESSKVIVIFICVFLTTVVTVYQGVCNVDATLLKAARVLGTKKHHLFTRVVVPASTPFILVSARLGLAAALTCLIAAEMTGTSLGLGVMIQKAQGYYDMATVLGGVIIIGIIGLLLEQLVTILERKFTKWQETEKK